jgi:putative transposase
MKKSRFSEEQIIGILKEQQAGLPVAEICRKHGISDATFYTWRSRYGGMEVSDARRLKALDEENRKLKKLLAEAMLDVATLREALGKTSDARGAESGRDLGDRREGLLAAARLRADRHGAEDVPLCAEPCGRCRPENAPSRFGSRAAAVRLSAAAHPAAA